jgi:hypothetical protein
MYTTQINNCNILAADIKTVKESRITPTKEAVQHAAMNQPTSHSFTQTCSKQATIRSILFLLTFKSKWSLQSSGSGKELIKTQK